MGDSSDHHWGYFRNDRDGQFFQVLDHSDHLNISGVVSSDYQCLELGSRL
ncbi:MAG: hypothetical protein ACI9E1_000310 [Cryomorphaceae bacterium]|jgi:hypothetical protein